MATNDARQAAKAAEFRQKLDAMVVAAADAKKKYDATRARVLAAEARAAAALIEHPSPMPPPAPAGRATHSDDDYEATVIANIYIHATSMQNIHSLVSVTLDLSSTHYAQWRDNVLLTLGCYSLSDHVLLDTTYVSVLAWDQMDSVIKLWI
jgi:hypothetical protein